VSRTRPTTLAAAALVAAAVLTGCGAGQVASTATQVSNTTGGNAQVGPLALRTVAIAFDGAVEDGAVYRRGEDAPLNMTVVNEAGETDRLVSASTPLAESVEISGTTDIASGRSLVVGGDTQQQGAGSPGGAPVTTPQPREEGEPTASVVLVGLREDVRSGISYPITFTFERAGDVTVAVPVDSTAEAREEAEGGE
jgi:copper(I)-binding protein